MEPSHPETARELLRRLRKIRPDARIYWADFLASAAVGWGALAATELVPSGGLTALLVVVAAFALWRAVYFIHEISHFGRGEVPGFELAFNLLVAMPLGLPSPMIDSHADHHRNATYGTSGDPEYEPVAGWSRGQIVGSVLAQVLVPAALFLRWAVLAPLGWLVPPLRRLLLARASSLVTNPAYVRRVPARQRRRWLLAEVGAALFMWAWVGVVAAGVVPAALVASLYAAMALALALNQLRTLVAHVYESDGQPLSRDAQVLDSVTIERGWLAEPMLPVGTRHHALHHLVPSLPYHALPAAHRALMRALPPDHAYRATCVPTFGRAVVELWRRAAAPVRGHRPGPRSSVEATAP